MIYSDIVNGMASNTSSTSNISSTKKDASIKSGANLDVNDFLKLLVTQMQYQDPMEPTDNTQYIAQMATFSQVDATTKMGAKTSEAMASSLVGKSVIMKTNDNADGVISGKVDYWEKIDGKLYLGIDKKLYDLDDLDTVLDDSYYNGLKNSGDI